MKIGHRPGILVGVFIIGAIVAVSTFGYSSSAHAEENSTTTTEQNSTPTTTQKTEAEARLKAAREQAAAKREQAEKARQAALEKRDAAKTRLQEAKLKACQAREKHITATMARMAERGKNQLQVFTKITDRVKTFYQEKGKVAANYDELVADVEAKLVAAQVAIDAAQAAGGTFSCDGDDPRTASQNFKTAHMEQAAALKEYRTAVKNLIVAVKSAQGEARE